MLLVSPPHVGVHAWHRMLRDGALLPATSENAFAPDVVSTVELRALAVTPLVTHRGALTGLAALWVWGCQEGQCPTPIDVAVPRGSHPDPPPRTTPHTWTWHTDSRAAARARQVAGIAVCSPADAVVTALRRADLGLAIAYGAGALRLGLCSASDIDNVLGETHPNAAGRARARAAWLELRELSFAVAS